ncbi:hypothetical protein U9M48_005359 [Paspalum notatum var. saurae]|uniref:Uncharacterized protein n=1 Tax=Paspalum notatum var. saurae TaxID=547442 RepID=A0AAQ3SLD4_PASNO
MDDRRGGRAASDIVMGQTLSEATVDDGVVHHHIRWAAPASVISHHMEQLKCLINSPFVAETLEKCVVCNYIGCAAKLRHSSEQHIHGFTHPLAIIETFEQLTHDCYIHPPACLQDEAKGRENEVQAARAAEGADEDAVGRNVGSHFVGGGTGHPVEAEVEEHRARETTVRSWLTAYTEAGLAMGINSSNRLRASSGPRLPERKRSAMRRSSSRHRRRAALSCPSIPTVLGCWPREEMCGRRRRYVRPRIGGAEQITGADAPWRGRGRG